MRLSPQDIDRDLNDQLDRDDPYGINCLSISTRGEGLSYTNNNTTGRQWALGRRRHGSMPSLDSMERRQR